MLYMPNTPLIGTYYGAHVVVSQSFRQTLDYGEFLHGTASLRARRRLGLLGVAILETLGVIFVKILLYLEPSVCARKGLYTINLSRLAVLIKEIHL